MALGRKIGDFLISADIILIFGMVFLRDRMFGEPNTIFEIGTITLSVLGLALTFPISIPCIILGSIFWIVFPKIN